MTDLKRYGGVMFGQFQCTTVGCGQIFEPDNISIYTEKMGGFLGFGATNHQVAHFSCPFCSTPYIYDLGVGDVSIQDISIGKGSQTIHIHDLNLSGGSVNVSQKRIKNPRN